MLARLAALLLVAPAVLTQEPEEPRGPAIQVRPDDSLHRFVEWETAADGASIEWVSDFEGTLHVWAQSAAADPVLAVTIGGADAVADDDSGGGTTAFVEVAVAVGDAIVIAAQTVGAGAGMAAVHWVASPETDETRAAVERAKELLADAEAAEAAQDYDRGRTLVAAALGVLHGAQGTAVSHGIAKMLWQLGHGAYRLGAIEVCSEAWSAALDARERTLPEDHPDLLAARQNLAVSMKAQGDLAGARALAERVLEACERTLPEDHPDLLTAQQNLANTMAEQGDLAGARALEERVLAVRERTLPEDHPELLAARLNLAVTMHAQGDFAGARALKESVLAARERTLPEDHPNLLNARGSLAVTMHAQGDLAGARALKESVLAARERTLPEDHPNLLNARGNLANTMYAQGDLLGARVLYERVLKARERTLREDHPDLLHTRQNLAVMMKAMGDLAGARALEESVLAAIERTLPEDHPDLLAARHNLAVSMKAQGDLAGARALYERVLAVRERTLPEDHPELLAVRNDLANTMAEQGDLAGARALQERVLEASERTLPEDHPDLLGARQNLANTRKAQGDLAGARALEESVLAVRERTLPEVHPDLLAARGNLALTMKALGDLAGARAVEERVLAVRERMLPEDHPDLLAARQNLAVSMKAQGDLAGARALAERVLEACERTLQEDHPDLLIAQKNLAVMMAEQGDLAGARALEERVLEARERTLPGDHPDLLRTRQNLANTMAEQGDHAGARALQERVLEASERTLPEDHPDVLIARQNLAVSMREQGDHAGARALQERVLEARERTLPEDHPDLLRARQNLAVTMAEQGDHAGARALSLDLAAGMLAGLEIVGASLSRREAQALVGVHAIRHSVVRFLSDSTESVRLRFDLAESLRGVSSGDAGGGEDDPELDTLRAEIGTVRGQLGDLLAAGPADGAPDDLSKAIERLTTKRDELERELRRELTERDVFVGAIRANDVAAALPDGAVAVGFLRTKGLQRNHENGRISSRGDVLAAHLLRPDGTLVEVELGLAADLERAVETWRAQLGKPIDRGIGGLSESSSEREAGDALREQLLDPLLAALDEETTTLLVCAADLVHAVPLDALPLGEKRVGDRYRVVNQASFRRLVAPHAPLPTADELELLAVGGAAFDALGALPSAPTGAVSAAIEAGERGSGRPARFEPLLFTAVEAEAAKLLFEAAEMGRSTVLTGENATKAAFREHAPGKRFVHVATHGWFAEMQFDEPEEAELLSARWGIEERVRAFTPLSYCGLAFAGANRGRDSLGRVPGIMTAEELTGADLSACELAVLSACETNVGLRSAGMGIESLQAALHAAGARTAITSLWRVDDAVTRKLMELFYTYLWVEKLPKAEALWKAKCDLRAAGHPVEHWAGWVLSGDPN